MPLPKAKRLYETTGQAIALLRKKRKWSQQKLAEAASLSRASIANIERGHHRIQLHVLYYIAAALEVEPHDLLPHPAKARVDRALPQDIEKKLRTSNEAIAVRRLLVRGKGDAHEDS